MREIVKKNIRSRRKKLNLTRDQLAFNIGMPTTSLRAVEDTGWGRPETIEKIAKGLNVKPYVLVKE